MIFVKNFPSEKSKGNERQTDFVCLIGRNIKMAKFNRLSNDAVFVFCAYGVFAARRFFTRARTYMWAYARTHTPVQRMRIYYWREKNGISAVGVL